MNSAMTQEHDEFETALTAMNRHLSDLKRIDTQHSQKMVIDEKHFWNNFLIVISLSQAQIQSLNERNLGQMSDKMNSLNSKYSGLQQSDNEIKENMVKTFSF